MMYMIVHIPSPGNLKCNTAMIKFVAHTYYVLVFIKTYLNILATVNK